MISLQVTKELVDEFDKIRKDLGFSSRSEALRESILFFIKENQTKTVQTGHKIASITVQHDIREDILDLFDETTRNYANLVKSMNQYNLKKKMVKTLIAAGDASEIDELYNAFATQRLFQCTLTYLVI